MIGGRFAACALAAWVLAGCSTSEGSGFVRSERLFVDGCWNGPFDLHPTFFGANPSADSLQIRVQRGSDAVEISDGLAVLVTDLQAIRGAELGLPLEVGLRPGVTPPGVPVVADPDPPRVSVALYLNDTCHAQTAALHALTGTMTFTALFSGDRNETRADDRLTEASFDVEIADPRDLSADGTVPAERRSAVKGAFRFFFERGQPAQPFP